jgi:hypothetical protein
MKIRVKDLVAFAPDKMAKIALATTERCQLDLYCVAAGQSQRAHTHEDQDKIYYVLEGRTVHARRDGARLSGGQAWRRPAWRTASGQRRPRSLLVILARRLPPPPAPRAQGVRVRHSS